MMHRSAMLFCLLLLSPSWGLAEEPIRMVSDPNLSPDGSQIAFTWRSDVWVADSSGGTARRLTTDPGNDRQPHFSPDGETVAFVSNRTGSNQIYLVPATGGTPRQVTFHSEGYSIHDWFPDGKYLLASGSRDHFWRGAERLLKVNVEQRRADVVLANATVAGASIDREGNRVLLVREGERWWRKGYKGERAAQIWMLDLESAEFTELLHEGIGCRWPLWNRNGKSFFFTKGDSHGFDLWRYRLPGSSEEVGVQTRITGFEDDSIVFPAIARNKNLIVFRHLFDLYRFQPGKDETPKKIEFTYAGDPNVDPDELRRTLDEADEVAFTEDGLEMIVAAGGDLWAMDTELQEPVRLTETGSFESSPVFGPDNQAVYTVAKRDGQVDIWKVEKLDEAAYWWQPGDYRWTQITDDPNVESDLRISPQGDHLYYVRDLGSLHRRTIDSDEVPIQLTNAFSAPDYDVSPCGQWVAYAETDDDFNSEIWIRRSDGSAEPHNISQHPDDDRSPRFSPDGKLLAFTARRIDTEVDIHYVWLQDEESQRTRRQRKLDEALQKMQKNRKEKASKDQPVSDAPTGDEPASGDDAEVQADTADGEQADKEQQPEATQIDFENITERIERISIRNAFEGGLFWSPEGDKLAFFTEIDGERGTYTVTFPAELTPKRLTSERISNPRWTKAAKGILGIVSNSPVHVDPNGKVNRYSFSAPQVLSRSERFRDGFEVAWMVMRDRWYDPRHANRNWAEVRRKFIEMSAAAGDESTFAEVVQLMLGELNGSHNGFSPRRSGSSSRLEWTDTTAHLGVRFDGDFAGPGLLVRDVLMNGPADRVDSSLQAGDVITRIDGVAVDPAMDLTLVLNGRLDRDIKLDVQRKREAAADVEEIQVTIRPISFGAARGLLYEHWLEHNRQMVADLSDDRFGYLHIRGMNMPSFYEFERQLYRVGYGREALVIDVRDNGGGSTTDLLLTALTQPRHAITVPRGGGPGYPQSRMVYAVWQKPIVVLCNQNSYSNAEIFSHAIKQLGRGKLVGVQTAGGVISTGSVGITDLGTMRMPFRGWFVADTGLDMELNGALPDHVVWPLPGELPAGEDRQLAKAVEVLTAEIAENPAKTPQLIYASEAEADQE
ncbi:S41 family peptidase [Planctomycetaceae bacterium SH139]